MARHQTGHFFCRDSHGDIYTVKLRHCQGFFGIGAGAGNSRDRSFFIAAEKTGETERQGL